jgi:hypothetical protein
MQNDPPPDQAKPVQQQQQQQQQPQPQSQPAPSPAGNSGEGAESALATYKKQRRQSKDERPRG